MVVIGLTGGIGTGKSTVSDYLTSKGYYVIDADKMAHEMTARETDTLNNIVKAFGHEILLDDGNLNRKKLGEIVFSNQEKLNILEELTTKVVVKNIISEVNVLRSGSKYDIIFIDAPLLFESGLNKIVDKVWLVDTDFEIRLNRIEKRDNVSREEAIKRIKNQLATDSKALYSDEIIKNSQRKEDLYIVVDKLLENYDEF